MQNYSKLLLTLTILSTSACFQYDSVPYTGNLGSGGNLPPYTGPDPYDYRAATHLSTKPKYYPKYDPEADNPRRDFSSERYEGYKYPKYNPADDNPYYPPSTYYPSVKEEPYKYKYPTFNPEADNPPVNRMFDEPMFNRPMFEN